MRAVLASGNPGKLREFAQLLAGAGLELLPQSAFGIEPPEETGTSFEANALLKARYAAERSGLAALADDSGLEVDLLGGRPGVCSARFAGPQADDTANNAKLLADLRARGAHFAGNAVRARFRCVIAWVSNAADPEPRLASGVWEGYLTDTPRGTGGFGYDPYFVDPLSSLTAAELPAAEKNTRSHRGQALRALLALVRQSAP
jgi:XTP/dITP diphosphohydrolase